jgi:hypothetical protein
VTVINPATVGVSGSLSVFTTGPQNVSGTVTTIQQGTVGVSGSVSVFTTGPQNVSGTVTVINPATVGVSGSVTVGTWGTNVTASIVAPNGVSIANWPAIIGVSGTVNTAPVYSLTPAGVSGTVTVINPATVGVSGSVTVGGWATNLTGSVTVGNLSQFSVTHPITTTNYDLNAAAYTGSFTFTADCQLAQLEMEFSTTQSRTVTVSLSDGTTLFNETDTNKSVSLDFENYAIANGSSITIAVAKTAGACLFSDDLSIQTLASPGTALSSNIPIPLRVALADSNNKPLWPSPFGELRVVNPYTEFDGTNEYDIDTRYYDQQFTNGATQLHLDALSSIKIAVTGNSGSFSQLRTNQYFRYQAGKAQRIRTTVVHPDTGRIGQTRRWGYFDTNDGLMFAMSGTTLQIVERSSNGSLMDVNGNLVTTIVSEVQYNQANWNYDKMDGSGPSGLTIDMTKGNIWEIAFQWLGYGAAQYFVNGFLVHANTHFNQFNAPYMRTGKLPLSYEVENFTSGSSGSINYTCSNVVSEGGLSIKAHPFSAGVLAASVTNGNLLPLLTIRNLSPNYDLIPNRILLVPQQFSVACSNRAFSYQLILNATLTGASFKSVNSESGAQFDIAATSGSLGTNAVILMQDFIVATGGSSGLIDLGNIFNESDQGQVLRNTAFALTPDTLSLFVNPSAGNGTFYGNIMWTEIR